MRLNITKQDRLALKKVFENFGRAKTDEEVFYDLCFCLCAPQTTFKNNIKVIQKLRALDFYHMPVPTSARRLGKKFYLKVLPQILKPVRFYNNKTKYLIEAKHSFFWILEVVKDPSLESIHKRDLLVKHIKGLGMKASSHFLRNMGDPQLAIIDTHIIKFLDKLHYSKTHDIFRKYPDNITKTVYIEMEKDFQKEASRHKLTTAELDAIIWKNYSGTNWEDFKY
jgi:N-glycosylase/DNA lyase